MDRDYVERKSKLIRRKVVTWGRENFKPYPWRSCSSPWQALVSELMLQRTRVSSVEPVWAEFVKAYPDLKSASDAGELSFLSILRPLGLEWRAQLIRDLVQTLYNRSRMPEEKEELLSLPGVGEYAASAYLSLHCGKREVIIDANVVRWICRMTGDQYDGETRRQPWLKNLADVLTPSRIFRDYNYAVLDFTMNVCTSTPDCAGCPMTKHCAYSTSN